MFFFFQVALLVLAAVAYAEPEADPQILVGSPYAYYAADPHATSGQQVKYSNGAVVPEDTLSVQVAKGQHFAAKAAAYPYGFGYYGAHLIGKREAEADPQYLYYGAGAPLAYTGLVAHPDGAVTPQETYAVQKATAEHFAAKGYKGPVYYGAAHFIGKREAEPEADAQYLYAGYPYVYANPHTSVGLTTYANGAVAPTKTLAVQQAEAQHFAAKAATYPYAGLHYIGKREAEAKPQFYGGYFNPYSTYGYGYSSTYGYLG